MCGKTPTVHGPKRRILHARVSAHEQARSGFSLSQRIQAPGKYVVYGGYGVLEEALDRGQSGANFARPGMDRVWGLVRPTNPLTELCTETLPEPPPSDELGAGFGPWTRGEYTQRHPVPRVRALLPAREPPDEQRGSQRHVISLSASSKV